jgi:hypothetical protein
MAVADHRSIDHHRGRSPVAVFRSLRTSRQRAQGHRPLLNGKDDARLCAAPANIALHGGDNRILARVWILPKQPKRGHNHARRTVAALHRVGIKKGLLERVQLPLRRQAFDRAYRAAKRGTQGRDARPRRLAVDQNGAGPAGALTAADLAARQAEIFAQDIKEWAITCDVNHMRRAIHDQRGQLGHGKPSTECTPVCV